MFKGLSRRYKIYTPTNFSRAKFRRSRGHGCSCFGVDAGSDNKENEMDLIIQVESKTGYTGVRKYQSDAPCLTQCSRRSTPSIYPEKRQERR